MEFHYIITGPPGTPYENGEYHGKLIFPPDYPFKPPAIKIFTPNGRFATNTRLCLSMSDFHPGTWNPAWSVATILTGLLSFMCMLCSLISIVEDTSTTGSIETSVHAKKNYALQSRSFNRKNLKFRGIHHSTLSLIEVFPDLCESDESTLEPPAPVTKPEEITTRPSVRIHWPWMLSIVLLVYLISIKLAERLVS